MTYRIERFNGESSRTAESWDDAIRIAESWMGQKLYQGASDYTADWEDKDGSRHYGYAADFWRDEEDAEREMGVPADVVIVQFEAEEKENVK
jgi:hypothetical protein